ncbi:uncharacterized protein C11orf97 homolog [Tiliqua scincoides]|uniref:uncharacterized protein C11orf97 homolog n=1 Tax=Tiliqua scincoides TaxID=71010 RepID=UPI0034630A59
MRAPGVGEPLLEPGAGGHSGSPSSAQCGDSGAPPWKKFIYVAPPRRVKEVLEEELYFRRDECRIKHPSEVALEGIWSLKRNFPMGGFKLASQNQSSLLSQPKYYSRHEVIKR